jgi:hypothetical protein
MNWPTSIGWLVFLAAPLFLWLLGSLANRGHGFAASVLAFVVGSDGRLSVSRLQAFLWTLVIFGSWFAAMAVHSNIGPKDPWVQIPDSLLALAGIAVGSGVFSSLIAAVNGDETTARVVSLAAVPQNDPRFVPGGVFQHVQRPKNPNALLIVGVDLGDGGRVRARLKGNGRRTLPLLLWKTDGTGILLDVPDGQTFQELTIETPNGKLTYELSQQMPDFILGRQKINYEFADLFRDDKNPENLSLMKFQMFGWTLIAIFIYVYLFLGLHHLTANITTLPSVDPNIAVLTGISQTGYLAGKGVSNVGANQ